MQFHSIREIKKVVKPYCDKDNAKRGRKTTTILKIEHKFCSFYLFEFFLNFFFSSSSFFDPSIAQPSL